MPYTAVHGPEQRARQPQHGILIAKRKEIAAETAHASERDMIQPEKAAQRPHEETHYKAQGRRIALVGRTDRRQPSRPQFYMTD